MKNDLNLKVILAKVTPILEFFKKYSHFMYFILLAGLIAFLVYNINSLSQREPTDDDITEKLQTIKRPNVDQNALAQIQKLQDQNVEVQTLFQQARDNPFSE